MLDVFEVGEKMRTCMTETRRLCSELDKALENKVNTKVEYDKELDIALVTLASEEVPVTIREKRAKGVLAVKGITRQFELAEGRWKILNTKIDAAEKELDAWRSYNRHLSTGVE